MASRHHYRSEGGRRHPTNQKKFVPKSQNASSSGDSTPNASFTSSLRENSRKVDDGSSKKTADFQSDGGSISSNQGEHDEPRTGLTERQVRFVNYLPQDEAVAIGLGAEDGGLDPVESQKVVDLMNEELSRLLKMKPRQFWKEVARESSVHDFLDSFLQFRSRWYDFPHHGPKETVAGVIVGETELSRRVFMFFYRLSSNKDPGARASDSLTPKEHTALLQESKLLDLPKLLDICAIYYHDNEELTRSLVSNAMRSQPWLVENLVDAVNHFLRIVHTMHKRCSSVLEVMDFINDAVSTLDAFVDAYEPAAASFSYPVETSDGHDELLTTLARLHDSLLTSLEQGFALISTTNVDKFESSFNAIAPNISLCLTMLSTRIVKFGWKLLDFCYLNQSPAEVHLLTNSTKMFPAKFEDPGIRGDIILQVLRELSMGVSYELQEHHGRKTFIQGFEKNFKILARMETLRNDGWIFLDDEQWKSLQLLVARNPSDLRENNPVEEIHSLSEKVQADEERVILESRISQIKDLFPDYGKGFLSACLEAYNQDAEEVIQRILEGTLHRDLKSLDVTLETFPPPKISRKDKGKGVLEEPVTVPSSSPVFAAKTNQGSSSSVSIGLSDRNTKESTSNSLHGRFVRKQKNDEVNSSFLDDKGAKDSEQTAVLASQYEYEDEYDDSLDDLGLSLVESGYEEAESLGDGVASKRGSSTPSEHVNAGRNSNLRWGQKKTQFYVKDGKNYSYKVSGGIAVTNAQEAALVNQVQRETIHGLGRGGNIPLGAVKALMDSGGPDQASDSVEAAGGRNSNRGRGRGRRGGRNHYQKDRSMKKHFSGLTGY
ncbi:Activating signal cointegrator 1 complex subunit 2 [Nymphaea thermarum]|nr:Activating signal cointegrator 1 complex subunit 2 [Nymphaea thermarum]